MVRSDPKPACVVLVIWGVIADAVGAAICAEQFGAGTEVVFEESWGEAGKYASSDFCTERRAFFLEETALSCPVAETRANSKSRENVELVAVDSGKTL